MSRRALFFALSTLLVLAIAYSLYWFHAAGLVRKSVAAWSEQHRAAGWQIEYREMAVAGFPAKVVVRLEAPSIVSPSGLGWRAEAVSAAASPLDLSHIHLVAAGRHTLTAGPWRAEATFADVQADLGFDRAGQPSELTATASGVGIEVAGIAVTAKAAALSLALDQAEPTFSVSADAVDFPPLAGFVLDRRIDRFALSGRLRGRVPPGTPTAALAAWSADGGVVEIEHLLLDWAPLGLEADGTIAFDRRLQPLAAFSARVRGTAPLLDRLAETRQIQPGAAMVAKTLMALMAKPDGQGRAAVSLPISLQDGQLWLGPVRVAAVPAIDWTPAER